MAASPEMVEVLTALCHRSPRSRQATEMMQVPHEERRVNRAALALAVALVLSLSLAPVALFLEATEPIEKSSPNPNVPMSSVLWTIPADGETNVSLDQMIIIQFSDPVDLMGWFDFKLSPDASPYAFGWSGADTTLTIGHARPFQACARHDARVEWTNSTGDINNYNWTFWTICSPFIVDTYPYPNQVNIPFFAPIIVNFSEPMDNTSLTYNVLPSGITFTEKWLNGDMTFVLEHTTPFNEMTIYNVTITAARSKAGAPLGPGPWPNPWRFATSCMPCVMILETYPPDRAIGVLLYSSIFINFSNAIDTSSFVFNLTPAAGTLTYVWTNGDQSVEILHSDYFAPCTLYNASVVQAKDIAGGDLGPGPVPNPWSFETECLGELGGLQVGRIPPSNVKLTWREAAYASHYLVYHSNNRFAPWPWAVIADVTTTEATISNHLSDKQAHFYIVRGAAGGAETSNSTMGVLWNMHFTLVPSEYSGIWVSLPYRTIYGKASDITGELGPNKINVVGKWDGDRQALVFYHYMRGMWRGTDFSINPGEGIIVGAISTFDWAINGTDGPMPLTFSFNPSQRSHYYWIGVPLTGTYGSAIQMVSSIAGGTGPGSNTRIIQVGKWNQSTQWYDVFKYTSSGWRGVDFRIKAGDSVYVEVVSPFVWTPDLITPEIP